MPKNQLIDPDLVRKPGMVEFSPVPVNQYRKSIRDERDNYSDGELMRIYHDMFVIREFETMLNQIKVTNEYVGVKYSHPGPTHLSTGQEAAAVGMAYTLGVDDFIFGSHRSHGRYWPRASAQLPDLMIMS